MMKIFLVSILVLVMGQAIAEDAIVPATKPAEVDTSYKKTDYQINSRYKAGAYLVYDCEGEYYACVDQDGSNKCREKRDESILKKETRLPCAPLKKFDDKKTCLLKNYEVVEALALKRFCYPKN